MIARYRISDHLSYYDDGLRTGAFVDGEHTILFNCCTGHESLLRELEPQSVYCTHHNRSAVAGLLAADAATEIICPAGERPLFDNVAAHWSAWRDRYHAYQQRPGPEVLAQAIPIARTVGSGERFDLGQARIRVVDTPGPTEAAVSYVLDIDSRRIAFCGDLICGDGQVWALHMLQKGFGRVSDYHGFLGARPIWQQSLQRLAALQPDVIVPLRGPLVIEPQTAINRLCQRLDDLWDNYVGASALNHYFPGLLVPTRSAVEILPTAEKSPPPAFVRRLPETTSYALLAASGEALLIDCGSPRASETIGGWQKAGIIRQLESVWVSHYHDDHTNALGQVVLAHGCTLESNAATAAITEQPSAWFLPCQCHSPSPPIRARRHGESWAWHEFRLTCFDLPGQTLHDAGLLVEGYGERVLFCGDTFAPTGLDDYCCGNRDWLGPGQGMARCLDLVQELQPTHIVNQHQELAFCFDKSQLAWLAANLEKRFALASQLTPWDNPNFSLDPFWAHVYPYEQHVFAGDSATLELVIMNHSAEPRTCSVVLETPSGWPLAAPKPALCVAAECETTIRLQISVPAEAQATATPVVVPIRLCWQGQSIGSPCHALLRIRTPR